MNMRGEHEIPAPRGAVWAALNDPAVLRDSIPGCQRLDQNGDNGFEATVKATIGPVAATFHGRVELTDVVPPHRYRIVGEGKGGAAGFAKGAATVTLEDLGGGRTRLMYEVDAAVGGKLAQIGSRLIDSTAKKLAADFFGRLAKRVATEPQPDQPAGVGADAPAATQAVATNSSDRRLHPAKLFVIGIVGCALLALIAGLLLRS